jgi:hypothetical protein
MAPEDGEPRQGITSAYISGGEAAATHFVDVGNTIELGVAFLAEHKANINGLGAGFDPDQFLRGTAGFAGLAAGCDYAVSLRRFQV